MKKQEDFGLKDRSQVKNFATKEWLMPASYAVTTQNVRVGHVTQKSLMVQVNAVNLELTMGATIDIIKVKLAKISYVVIKAILRIFLLRYDKLPEQQKLR